MWSKKVLVSILFAFVMVWLNYSFAGSGELLFDQSNVDVHLYCTTPTVNVIVSGDVYNSYTADMPFVDGVVFSNPNQTAATAFGSKTMNNGVCWSLTECLRFVGSKDDGSLSLWNNGWTITLQNSWYLRQAIVSFTWYRESVQSVVSSGLVDYTTQNGLLALFSMDVYLYPGPCAIDWNIPVFAFTGGMIPHVTNYTWPQFNDRMYIFNLYDPWSIDRWFSSWFTNDRDADWTGGTYYEESVLNGSGIDLSTFVMEVGVETTPESDTFTVVTLTGTLNYTGWATILGSVVWLEFHPYDFTWNRWNRNYTGQVSTGALWPASTADVDGNRTFGTEKEVVMTWYIYDRANKKSALFLRHFNYGAIPWSSNQFSGWLVQYCGPNGSQTIGVVAPTTDSGAYITKYNDYFILEPFKAYLHDDWAGIDTGTIEVYLSGTQWGIWTGVTLTVDSSEITITPFSWYGPINIMTDRGVMENVYSVPWSTRNYVTEIDYDGEWDPETKIEISIDYKDLISRTGTQITCDYHNTYAPYANNWDDDVHLSRTPFSSGARLSGFEIKLEDEWAGIDSWSIVVLISGSYISDIPNRTSSPVVIVFDSWSTESIFNMLSSYTTHQWTTDGLIVGGQLFNYTVTIDQTDLDSQFSWYFAPEYPFEINISYQDFAGNTHMATKQYTDLVDGTADYAGNTNENMNQAWFTNVDHFDVYINENPLLRRFSVITDPIDSPADRFEAFPIRTYGNVTGWIENIQYSGFEFGIFDHWAGVDGDYSLVVIEWERRWTSRTYSFVVSGSSLIGNAAYTTADMTGLITQEAVLVSDYDLYTGDHPTVQRSTWYKFQIDSGHNIYFDYGYYSWSEWSPAFGQSYDVDVYASDLKPGSVGPNTTIFTETLNLDTLQCRFLNRCSHELLTFVWWDFPNDNPLTGAIDNPFAWSRLSVVGSWVMIDTWTHTISCTAWLGLSSPITLDFTNAPNLTGAVTWSYQDFTLQVADGFFELSGDVLIVR